MFSTPSGSYKLSTLTSARFSEPEREGFDGDIPFRAECSKVSHSLLWVSMLLSSTVGKSYSDDT